MLAYHTVCCPVGVVAFKRQTNLKINNCVSVGSIQGVPAARLERRIPSAPLQFDLIKFTSREFRERIHYQCSQQTKQIDYFDKTQSSQGGHTHTHMHRHKGSRSWRQIYPKSCFDLHSSAARSDFAACQAWSYRCGQAYQIFRQRRWHRQQYTHTNTHIHRAEEHRVLAVTSLGRERRLQPFIDS